MSKQVQRFVDWLDRLVEQGIWSYRLLLLVVVSIAMLPFIWSVLRLYTSISALPFEPLWRGGPEADIGMICVLALLSISVERSRLRVMFLIVGAIAVADCIVSNAIIYRTHGLLDMIGSPLADQEAFGGHPVVRDPTSMLYFSIVTFTTLGYGDLVPTAGDRMTAALEALFSYGITAMFIAMVASILGARLSGAEQKITENRNRRWETRRKLRRGESNV